MVSGWKIKKIISIIILAIISLHNFAMAKPCKSIYDNLPPEFAIEKQIEELPITANLLDMIDDDCLRELVIEGIKNNPALKSTALRLRAKYYRLSKTRSKFLPRLGAGFLEDRFEAESNPSSNRLGFLQFSWELDVWRKLSDEHSAAKSDYGAQRQYYLKARDILSARIIQTWINIVALKNNIDILQDNVNTVEKLEKLAFSNYRRGLKEINELNSARKRTKIARNDLEQLKEQHSAELRNLEVLIGRIPVSQIRTGKKLPEITCLPKMLRVDILRNRADIQAALNKVESSKKLAKAAKKARLPKISMATQLLWLVLPLFDVSNGELAWNILGALIQPLFQGGALVGESKAKALEKDASLAELYQNILLALQEVENVFGREAELTRKEANLYDALCQLQKNSSYYRERYKRGISGISEYLNALVEQNNTEQELNETRGKRLGNRVDLAIALGVGIEK